MVKRISCMVIGVVCLLTLLLSGPVLAADATDTNSAIQQIKDIQQQLSKTQSTISDVQAQMKTTDTQIAAINSAVDTLNTQIAALDAKMASTKAQVDDMQNLQNEQEKELEARIRTMYMYGSDSYLEILFSSKNFTELLSRMDNVKAIMQADRDAVNNLEATKEQIASHNSDLESQKAQVEEAKKAQDDAKTALEKAKSQQTAQLAQLQKEYDSEKAAGQAVADKFGLNGLIQLGNYYWPIDPSNAKAFVITSPFGYRGSEATGGVGTAYHEGVDIGADAGTPVMAIADGTVTQAGPNGGYGNFVAIDHGTDTSGQSIGSSYGHMQSLNTTTGATVKKGDVIGYVGSTGNSTGPHLHLNIIVNKQNVDPLTYFPQYTSQFTYQ